MKSRLYIRNAKYKKKKENKKEGNALLMFKKWLNVYIISQSAGCVKYIDCISTGVYNPCPTSALDFLNTKQSDGDASVILELWGIRSTSLLPSLPGPLCPGVVIFMGQMELNRSFESLLLFAFKLRIYAKLICLK